MPVYLPRFEDQDLGEYPEVIKIDGRCYEKAEFDPTDPDYQWGSVEQTYDDCELCQSNAIEYRDCFASDCDNEDPQMILTVSGNGPLAANQTVNWCGETWTPEEDGDFKTVCPDSYRKRKYTSIYTYPPRYGATHYWRKSGDSLNLGRRYLAYVLYWTYPPNISRFTADNYNRLSAVGQIDLKRFRVAAPIPRPIAATFSNTVNGDLSFILGLTEAKFSTYTITDDFFGEYTDGNNITYKWERGLGWPASV
jgi:hypothetical protein